MIPNIFYMVLYYVFVVCLKDTPYAWPDVYHVMQVNKYGHYELMLIGAIIFQCLIINAVRVIHNIQHKRYKEALEEYYKFSEDFKEKTIDELCVLYTKYYFEEK